MIKIPKSLTIYKGGRCYKGKAPLALIPRKMVEAKLKSIDKKRYKDEAKEYEDLLTQLPEAEKKVEKKKSK